MGKTDLLFIHAPSVYDFRKSSIMYGPVSDLVPSGPIFEMFPIGFTMLGGYLERRGYNVRIVNLAALMLRRPNLDVEKYIASLDARLIGIDLHWLPHCHGSIEVARLVKKAHPETPVIFGGFSSTYFHDELIRYPEVDFVMKGDSTEVPLEQLLSMIKSGSTDYGSVPNLSWKDGTGAVHHNPIDYLPADIDHIPLDYGFNVRSVFRYRRLRENMPFDSWMRYPITAIITCRGCTHECITCGASATACSGFLKRDKPAFRSPELVAEDIGRTAAKTRAPLFILGDIRQSGDEYANRLLMALRKKVITNQVAFEFFDPPPLDFVRRISASLEHWSIEISMESHDPQVRHMFGKMYSNEELEQSIDDALSHGCERADLYFMTGLPKQTAVSVLQTGDYARHLYERVRGDRRLLVFTSPMAPFLDPGSVIFENPESHGYRMSCRTLEEHRQALTQPSWKYILNYETDWMTRDEMVDATYRAAVDLNRVKAEYGCIEQSLARQTERRIDDARRAMAAIDEIMAQPAADRPESLVALKEKMDVLNVSTVCEKRELEWPTGLVNFRPAGLIGDLIGWRKGPLAEANPIHGLRMDVDDVRAFFSRYADRYDFANRLVSLGLDRKWRRLASSALSVGPESKVLDACTGTGEFALEIWRSTGARVIGVDLSPKMVASASWKAEVAGAGDRVEFREADAERLPFGDGEFDAVAVAFGLGNTERHSEILKELRRVTRPGGQLVCLECGHPPVSMLRQAYLRVLNSGPNSAVGRVVAGDAAALQYLRATVGVFPAQEQLTRLVDSVGWDDVDYQNLAGGMVALHRATNPGN